MPTTTLRPDPGAAALWSAWGGLLVAAGIWFVRDTAGSPVAWLALVVFAGVAGTFVVQLAAPAVVEVRLTQDELQVRTLWVRRRIPWETVHLARVRTVLGDPVLELHLSGTGELAHTGVLLPVGADLKILHRFLAARLGSGGLRVPDRLHPLEPT